jgi:hypothetical protein
MTTPTGNLRVTATELFDISVQDPETQKWYAVSVSKIDRNGHATNITRTRGKNWEQTALEIIKVLKSQTSTGTFTSGVVTLQGDFSDIEQPDINLNNKRVSIASGEVKYKEAENAPDQIVQTFLKGQGALTDQHRAAVFHTLSILSDSLVQGQTTHEPINNAPGRPNVNSSNNVVPNHPSNAPQSNQPNNGNNGNNVVPNNQNNNSQPKQQTVTVTQDERMEVCKNREKFIVCDKDNKAHPSLDYALAHQLKNMGSLGDGFNFNAKTEKQIAESLRKNIGKFIKKMPTPWIQAQYFKDIVDSLKDAWVQDCACYQRTITKHSKQNITGWANSLNSTSLTNAEKEKIVELYADYIIYGGKCIGNTFLSAFVDYNKNEKIYFQVVMIEGNGPIVKKAISYPNGENIDSTRCAFIYRNNYEYLSYNREASLAGPTELAQRDLNHPTNNLINSKPKETSKNKNVGGKIFTIEMPSDGQCLDRSIAYHLTSTNPSFANLTSDQKESEIKKAADYIRKLVADKIRLYNNDNDEKFYQLLKSSIASIPAFAKNETNEAKEYSRARLEGIFLKLPELPKSTEDNLADLFNDDLPDEEFYVIKNKNVIINKEYIKKLIDKEKLAPNEKIILRRFYAEYIIQEDTENHNNMNNHLESAFLYMLPKIRSKDFKNGINCAVVQDGKIIGVFGQQDAIIDDNWFFINFINKNHYNAVDMQASKTKVNSMIDDHYKTILNHFITVVHHNLADTVEAELLDLKKSHPTAYYAFCELIWWREHNKWEHKELPNEPAYRMTFDNGELEKIDQYKTRIKAYGNAALTMPRTITTDELAELLRSFKPEDLHKLVADNGIIF